MAERTRRRLSPRKKLLFGLVTLAVCLLTCEGVLRLAGYPQGLVRSFGRLWNRDAESLAQRPGLFRPNFEGRVGYPPELAYGVSFNDLGLRGPPADLAKPPGTLRILALGDSVTFGYHVEDDETYPVHLEQRLRAAGLAVEVLNGGCGHFTITDELPYLRDRLLDLDPDLVVLQFCANDVSPHDLDRSPTLYEEILVEAAAGPPFSQLLRSTALGEAQLRLAIALKRWRQGPRTDLGQAADDVPERCWTRYGEELERLSALLREREVPLLLVGFPDLGTVEAAGPSGYDTHLSALAAELEVPYASLLTRFRAAKDPRSLYLYPLDGHPSDAGHALLAEVVHEQLEAAGWLKSPGAPPPGP
jgi:lysophospholipase L1-like esterase